MTIIPIHQKGIVFWHLEMEFHLNKKLFKPICIVLFKMREIIVIDIILAFIGLAFIYYLCTRLNEIYGNKKSIQFWSMMILLVILIACLVIDLFSCSVLEFLVGDLSELPRSTIETYFSSLVTVIIGFVGVILIVCSVLYGSFYVAYSRGKGENVKKLNKLKNEREKLVKQCKTWLAFLVYFIAVMGVLFIRPLMNQLHP